MNINWKKTIFIVLDLALVVYLVLAVTSFNRPTPANDTCTQVQITIADNDSCGFLSALEVKHLLESKHLYPKGKKLSLIDLRAIETALKENSFIEHAECHKTQNGNVGILVEQRLPMMHVKADNGEDYYIDVNGNIMQGGHYASNLIIATGNISNWYAQNYIAPVCQWIASHDLWKNQVEQINLLPDKNIELVPRIGNHIVCLGRLPETNDKERRERLINQFVEHKMDRLYKFYRYGLNEVGWNKYSYIDLEFDNQIICRKNKHKLSDDMLSWDQTSTPATSQN
jgi:cell division protein FtsQ